MSTAMCIARNQCSLHLHVRAISLQENGAWLIFIALGIKAAFPFLHNWLQDSYPKATVVGAVVLSAFTTKLAVYAFARMFPGHEPLIWISRSSLYCLCVSGHHRHSNFCQRELLLLRQSGLLVSTCVLVPRKQTIFCINQ